MTVTRIIHAVVLRQSERDQLLPWIDDVVHRIMPAVVFVDQRDVGAFAPGEHSGRGPCGNVSSVMP